jgi:acid phosphatase
MTTNGKAGGIPHHTDDMPVRRSISPWVLAVALIATISLLGTIVAISGRPDPASSPSSPIGRATPSPAHLATSLPAASAAATRHVWWIILENHEYGAIIGNRQAPYLNALASRYGLATDYYATSHPSEPNYLALAAGSTLGFSGDGVYNTVAPSLFSQLAAADQTWRVYAQDDQAGCYTGTVAGGGADGPGAPGTYARRHNPAISFTSVSGSPTQCANIQPLQAFDPVAGSFELIVPNLANDMHDGSVAMGDAFVGALVPKILESAAFQAGGVLFITFDEGTTNAGSGGDHGGHIATLIIAADLPQRSRDTAYADHGSLLRTTEAILGLPCLAGACRSLPLGY